MTERGNTRVLRARRRKRRLVRGFVRTVFWALVLAGVFILGIGYGRTLSGDDSATHDKVTVTQDRGTIEATLPTKTVTVTKTQVARTSSKGAKSTNRTSSSER